MFNILAKEGTTSISFERFARLGVLLGISKWAILQRLKEFGIGVFDSMDYEVCI